MTQKPHTYVADLTDLPKALQHLTEQKRWVIWRWELRSKPNGAATWTKPPFQCGNPWVAARSNDPSTWGTYDAALAAVAASLADGIGFMLKDSEVAAADLDHVRDASTGELVDWAVRLCVEADNLGLYREVTVSGGGLRFIGLSQGDSLHRKFTFNRQSGAGIELYRNCARYITVSGLQEGSCQELEQIPVNFTHSQRA
jgi:primase-polymerase (primpol)-like protein